jgi:hypothetical protein
MDYDTSAEVCQKGWFLGLQIPYFSRSILMDLVYSGVTKRAM